MPLRLWPHAGALPRAFREASPGPRFPGGICEGAAPVSEPGLPESFSLPSWQIQEASGFHLGGAGGASAGRPWETGEKNKQPRTFYWGKRDGGGSRRAGGRKAAAGTHGASRRRDLLCSAYPWGGRGKGRSRLKPPFRLRGSTSGLGGEFEGQAVGCPAGGPRGASLPSARCWPCELASEGKFCPLQPSHDPCLVG